MDKFGKNYARDERPLSLKDPKGPQFLAVNRNAQMSVLVEDDGRAFLDSNAILLYLAKLRSALMPWDNHAHGLALEGLIGQATAFNSASSYALNARARTMPDYDDPAKIAESIRRWTAVMNIFDRDRAKARASCRMTSSAAGRL